MPRKLLENKFELVDAEIDNNSAYTENALISNVRKLTVSGKTYQNFCTYNGEFINDQGNYKAIEELTILKSNTTYTVEVDLKSDNVITTNNKSIIFRVDQYDIDENGRIGNGVAGTITSTYQTFKFTFTTVSNFKRAILILRNNFTALEGLGLDSNTMYAKNIKVVEGDYTNTDLPASINGIESVAEREKTEANLYPIQIAQSHNETDGIVLPNGVTNVVENNNTIKKIGKFTIDGSTILLSENNLSLNTIRLIQPVTDAKNATNERDLNFLTEGNIPKDHSIWSNDKEGIFLAQSNNRFILRVNRSRFTNINQQGFIDYFSSNPIAVWYELYTPITEPCVVTEVNMPIPLRSLPNGIKDTIENGKVVQRIGVSTLTGNEVIVESYTGWTNKVFCFENSSVGNIKKVQNIYTLNCIVDSIPAYDIQELVGTANRTGIALHNYASNGNPTYIHIAVRGITTVDDLKTWLQLNPVTIYYELETPIEHTINIPPISISKGTNMVTTNNNIKPELTFKYKRKYKKTSTNIIKYLYNSGNEYLNVTGGWNTQLNASYGAATTMVKNTNNIYFPTGVWNMLLTNNKIDVTNYDVVYMKYSKEYNPYNFHPARCAIKLGNKNTSWNDFANDETTGALIGKDETENNVTNGILTIDVSNVTGSYYVGVGGQSNNITVHEIGLKKNNNSDTTTLYSNGNECIELTGGYLTSSNNSATCNIEKQADNLYVNCTGKQSFDSICYARTNKIIKPCKIKVSAKNNYISANGTAFCMFLSEKEAINSVSEFNSITNKRYIKASNTTQGQYIDLEIDLTDNTEGYFYIACMVAGSADYTCKANIRKIEIIR